jgi:hypothetical protein
MTGTGKSFLLKIFRSLFGKYATAIAPGQLLSPDNRYTTNMQFIQVDEAADDRSKGRAQASRVKDTITRDVLWTNPKYVAPYELPDVTNYGFTSNFADGLYLDNTDRRLFVIHVTEKKLLLANPGLAKKLDEWQSRAELRQRSCGISRR